MGRPTRRSRRARSDPEAAAQRGYVNFSMRLPLDLHGLLEALAQAEDRSLHAQALHVLRGALEAGAAGPVPDQPDEPAPRPPTPLRGLPRPTR